ncbi:hypothetical protein PspLS_07365 [Pyricularia sp. CBS 133598]|nr:hypothetical protein PspLS_07365 [Pyricularia sp. CBS 133598]
MLKSVTKRKGFMSGDTPVSSNDIASSNAPVSKAAKHKAKNNEQLQQGDVKEVQQSIVSSAHGPAINQTTAPTNLAIRPKTEKI